MYTLDMPESFELIKLKNILIIMSNMSTIFFFFYFYKINIQEKLHMYSCCTTHHFVPYMHIDKRTACFFFFFWETYKNMNFLQICSTEQVTPFSGQSIAYMLNPRRASITKTCCYA